MKAITPLLIAALSFSCLLLSAQSLNPVVQEAYELRMNNQADGAADLLKSYIKKDTSDAMVYFEYARTLCHLSPEQPGFNFRRSETTNTEDTLLRNEALLMINQAIRLDPWNYHYQSLKGDIIGSLGDKYSREFKRSQYTQWNSVMENNFEVKPSTDLAIGMFYFYAYESIKDSVKAKQQIKKYIEYLKVNNRDYKYKDFNYAEIDKSIKPTRLEYYTKLLTTDSLNAGLLKLIGSIYFAMDSVKQGIEFYEKALKISGDYQEVLGFLWNIPRRNQNSRNFHRPVPNEESKLRMEKWKSEKITAFIDSDPNAPSKCLAYMALRNIYSNWGEEEQANEMDLLARETEPYFYKIGHYDDTLLMNPVEVFEYCNLGEYVSD